MYGIYDKDGMLRFVNSNKEACLDYAELFEFSATNYCLMNFTKSPVNENYINLDLNQEGNNN